jgi:hypothetical protein
MLCDILCYLMFFFAYDSVSLEWYCENIVED